MVEGLQPEFYGYLAIGSKDGRTSQLEVLNDKNTSTIFRLYSLGLNSSRDSWIYDFSQTALLAKTKRFIETYNGEVDKWARRAHTGIKLDDFVLLDETKIKWSEGLKLALQRKQYAQFSNQKERVALYRPFCKKSLFFDKI